MGLEGMGFDDGDYPHPDGMGLEGMGFDDGDYPHPDGMGFEGMEFDDGDYPHPDGMGFEGMGFDDGDYPHPDGMGFDSGGVGRCVQSSVAVDGVCGGGGAAGAGVAKESRARTILAVAGGVVQISGSVFTAGGAWFEHWDEHRKQHR